MGVDKESSSERGSEIESGGIIVLKEGAEVIMFDIQAAGILPSDEYLGLGIVLDFKNVLYENPDGSVSKNLT